MPFGMRNLLAGETFSLANLIPYARSVTLPSDALDRARRAVAQGSKAESLVVRP